MPVAHLSTAARAPRASAGLGPWIAFALILAFLLVFLILPVGTVIYTAFVTDTGALTVGHFGNFFDQLVFRESFFNSLWVALASTFFASVIALPLAYLTVRFEFRGALLIQTLGVLPLGTLNHFARDVGMPAEPEAAAQVIASSAPRAVDVAEVNGHVYVNNSLLGAYPYMVADRERRRDQHGLGKWTAMTLAFLRMLWRFPRRRLTLCFDGGKLPVRKRYQATVFVPYEKWTVDTYPFQTLQMNCQRYASLQEPKQAIAMAGAQARENCFEDYNHCAPPFPEAEQYFFNFVGHGRIGCEVTAFMIGTEPNR